MLGSTPLGVFVVGNPCGRPKSLHMIACVQVNVLIAKKIQRALFRNVKVDAVYTDCSLASRTSEAGTMPGKSLYRSCMCYDSYLQVLSSPNTRKNKLQNL